MQNKNSNRLKESGAEPPVFFLPAASASEHRPGEKQTVSTVVTLLPTRRVFKSSTAVFIIRRLQCIVKWIIYSVPPSSTIYTFPTSTWIATLFFYWMTQGVSHDCVVLFLRVTLTIILTARAHGAIYSTFFFYLVLYKSLLGLCRFDVASSFFFIRKHKMKKVFLREFKLARWQVVLVMSRSKCSVGA